MRVGLRSESNPGKVPDSPNRVLLAVRLNAIGPATVQLATVHYLLVRGAKVPITKSAGLGIPGRVGSVIG